MHVLKEGDIGTGVATIVRPFYCPALKVPVWIGVVLLDEGFGLDPLTPVGDVVRTGFWTTTEVAVGDEIIFTMATAPYGLVPVDVQPLAEDFLRLANRLTSWCDRQQLTGFSAQLRAVASLV